MKLLRELIGVLCLLGLVTSQEQSWYKSGVIYQLYPRSFQDTDGDGIGDLQGVLQHVDYLADLGIDAVWFSPIYTSPNKDFGYDISDFTDVNPEYGTLKDFEEVAKRLEERGVKVLMDYVPNHTSTKHRWFELSENKDVDEFGNNYTSWYVWKDPKGTDINGKPIPPNNWLGVINTGSAWKWSEKRKQFYLHNFLESQADLNYLNPDVQDAMEGVLKFWMRKKVAGFRVDAVNWIYEDTQYRDEPPSKNPNPNNPNEYNNLDHIYTQNLPPTYELVKAWRNTVDTYTHFVNDTDERVLIVESYAPLEKLILYYGNDSVPGCTFPFNFLLLFDINKDSNSTHWAREINNYYKQIAPHWPNWVLGNHDQMRVPDRWTPEWVDILHMITMTLKGTVTTYYGEEIGLPDSTVRWDQALDFQGIIAGREDFATRSRDFYRGPMPWNNGTNGGFTNGSTPWLPLAPNYWKLNVEAQEEAKKSTLHVYRDLVKLRKTMTLKYGDCAVTSTPNDILYIIRSYKDNPTFVTVVNIGNDWTDVNLKKLQLKLPSFVRLLIASSNIPFELDSWLNPAKITLPPKTGIIVST